LPQGGLSGAKTPFKHAWKNLKKHGKTGLKTPFLPNYMYILPNSAQGYSSH
jgi:hypothetical protein